MRLDIRKLAQNLRIRLRFGIRILIRHSLWPIRPEDIRIDHRSVRVFPLSGRGREVLQRL